MSLRSFHPCLEITLCGFLQQVTLSASQLFLEKSYAYLYCVTNEITDSGENEENIRNYLSLFSILQCVCVCASGLRSWNVAVAVAARAFVSMRVSV